MNVRSLVIVLSSVLSIVLVTVFLALTAFMGYLIHVQFGIQHDHYEEYSHQASQMHWQRLKDVPTRGDIVDRSV